MFNKIILSSALLITSLYAVPHATASTTVSTNQENIRETFVSSGDAKLFCRVAGKGNPLIVIHGGPGLTQDYLLPQMYRLAENNLVIFYDQRGCGKSTGDINQETITIDKFVDDLEAIRQSFNFDKISILGHSWGGFLAMNYSIAHPEHLEKLILSNSMPASSEEYALFGHEWTRRMRPYEDELAKIHSTVGFHNGDPDVMEHLYRIIFRTYCYIPEKADLLSLCMTPVASVNGAKVNENFRQNVFEKSFNLHGSLKSLKATTLVLHGDADPIPPSTAQNTHKSIPNSKYFLMKNCGHFPYVEDPNTYFKYINAFLSENEVALNEIETVDREKAVSPVSSIVLKEVVDILSNHFNTQVQVGSIIQLSEKERRNLILRINIQNPSAGVPKSIILKQTLPQKLSDDSNKISDRFARDWTGLEFLSMLKTDAPPVPKFYGGSLEHKFILIEDLGKNHISLVDSLTGDNANEAEIALLRFMIDLGKLHASSYGKTEDYFKILRKVNTTAESWQDDLQKTIEKDLPALKLSLKSLNMEPPEDVLSEIHSVFKSNLVPGPFTTLIHGDICPDNVFYNREKKELYLIDFEWSFVKNALLDGTYLRMSFPTCWCAKAVPDRLISTLESSYREQLKKTIPAARSEEEYRDAYVNACAFWMLKSLLLIEVVLEKEDMWSSGPTPPESLWKPEDNRVRPRILSRLISFIEISKAYEKLPHLSSMAEEVLKKLKIRWPEAKPLELYPAFSKN
ncbi:MAG: alpha/beta fold hydrolase [Parachlamydiaceae bacterium]|nr:alpha/beta fold hydrolase [Parachlamydiaceae bacterium]